ncbi:MAG: DNA-binding domain-containing protein, partial [Parabacteroides sp.]|nr:DNA-binding domain-containing protein [Parabacteroides sp.]
VTTDNKDDKILVLESAGSLTEKDILDRMLKEITGLKAETLNHAVDLYNRIVMESLLNGYTVNTGLFYASPSFQGVIDGGVWDKEKNSIRVNFQQGKTLRDEIAQTKVEILGEKADIMYVLEVEDKKTGLKDGTATPGYGFIIKGRNLKVGGTDESVGVYLINEGESAEKLPDYQIIKNMPSELIIQIPTGLLAGPYTLRITTQYSSSNAQLKVPKTLDYPLTIVNE